MNIGTAALERPEWCEEIIGQYGDKIAIGLDVRGTRLAARGWTREGGDLWDTLERLDAAGCARYVVTDVRSDGMLSGPNLELLRDVCERTDAPVVASGGISSLTDIADLAGLVDEGVEGAIIGTALYVGNFTLQEALVAAQRPASPTGSGRVMSAPSETFRRADGESRPVGNHAVQKLDGRLRDLLAGKKILMTGVTGFIGEQLFWKILTELPDTTPAVLVRKKRSQGAWERMVAVVKKDIFKDLRESAGGPEELLKARVEVIEGDLPNVPKLPRDIDIVVHCAGDVSFDPPIDQAFTTNVIGTKALMERMIEACSDEHGHWSRSRTTCTSRPPIPRAGGAARSPRRRTSTPSTTTRRPRPGWRCAT